MSSDANIRIFIGSGEASLLERKVFIYSIKKHTSKPVDIYVFNGTHNAVEKNAEKPFLAPMSLRVKYYNFTEFSNYRFLIPQLCNFQGKAIYADSDMICLGDISDLIDMNMQGADMLARADAYQHAGDNCWGMSLSVYNCSTCKFDVEKIFDEIEQGKYTYSDLHQMTPKFLQHYPYKLKDMGENWNVFDYYDANTKLIHYTNLDTQPWKYPGHPYGELWFQYFKEAREAGYITEEDINKSIMRAYVRKDILQGNQPAQSIIQPLPAKKNTLLKKVYGKLFN